MFVKGRENVIKSYIIFSSTQNEQMTDTQPNYYIFTHTEANYSSQLISRRSQFINSHNCCSIHYKSIFDTLARNI